MGALRNRKHKTASSILAVHFDYLQLVYEQHFSKNKIYQIKQEKFIFQQHNNAQFEQTLRYSLQDIW
jgi:hypothetical protein